MSVLKTLKALSVHTVHADTYTVCVCVCGCVYGCVCVGGGCVVFCVCVFVCTDSMFPCGCYVLYALLHIVQKLE